MSLYGDADCFVNVGSNVTGTHGVRTSIGCGLLSISAGTRVTDECGMVIQYLAKGVPVIHLLNMKALCSDNGLPFDPARITPPGSSEIYFIKQYPVLTVVIGLFLVALLLVAYRFAGKLLPLFCNLDLHIEQRSELISGVLLVLLGLAMPGFLTVHSIGIYDNLYFALEEGNSPYLLLAAFKLLAVNTIRALPHYLGAFFIADSIAVSRRGWVLTVLQMLILFPVILLVYQLIQIMYGLRYDFGVPAMLMILLILMLNIIDFRMVPWAKKALMVFFMLATVQSLDLMPQLSSLPFGHGEATADIKAISSFLGMDGILDTIILAYFALMTVCTCLFVILIRDENHIITVNQQNAQREHELTEARLATIENRTYMELNHLVHDLKTPLTSIQVLVGVVKLRSQDASVRYLDSIESSVERMSLMISEFLDENKLTRIRAADLVRDLLSQVSNMEYAKCVTVQCKNEEICIAVNRVRFSRMLVNLLENAYHAIDPKSGRIMVGIARMEQGGTEMVGITVEDNGSGMSAEVVKSMWTDGFSMSGSYGLGLSFVKKVVERNNGTVQVESAPGKGTRFTILIPEEEN
jgi:signal transduction histidine kinase